MLKENSREHKLYAGLIVDINGYVNDYEKENMIDNLCELVNILSRVQPEVKPACDDKILQAKIDENEYWLKFLNADASNMIHKTSLMDRVKFLENENRKSV